LFTADTPASRKPYAAPITERSLVLLMVPVRVIARAFSCSKIEGDYETRFRGLLSDRYAPQPDGQAVANELSNSLYLHTVPPGKNLITAGAGRDPN